MRAGRVRPGIPRRISPIRGIFPMRRQHMDYENILVEREAPLATVTMNRPEKRNALSTAMMTELIDAFRTLGRDKAVRAIILGGNGPAFSAGHDLRELV